MPNTNPQAILVANTKVRPCADRFGQLYNYCKSLQAQAAAEGWTALFPVDGQTISDGSATDGRTPILDDDVASFITLVGSFITFLEQNANANRNLVFKIAVNPEKLS